MEPSSQNTEQDAQPLRRCAALRVTAGSAIAETVAVVTELPLTITVDGVGAFTLMCTPTHLPALAVGFAFSEGLIISARDIDILYHCDDDPTAIQLRLARAPATPTARNLIVSSACGLCGTVAVEALIAALPAVQRALTVPAECLHRVQAAMRGRQQLFAQTGGAHAAALFAADGEIVAFAEDIGRHNALDKCLGQCLLAGRPTAGCGALLSGRVSLEMVVKAARAGIELLGAVSAPSSLAIDAAARCGITLCGFVREDRLTAFTHPERIAEAGKG